MQKVNCLVILFFVLTHCSIDTKTGLWQNKNSILEEKAFIEINFDKELSFDEFKENVVLYGKKSNYPSIVENNE
tara:strand:+ start:315 stop:536 length:222 start_codon:yes stop_codon:yes gene_type:complete